MKVVSESNTGIEYENEEGEDDDGAYGFSADSSDDTEYSASTSQGRRVTSKKRFITPRLCSSFDKAKVKKMGLKK